MKSFLKITFLLLLTASCSVDPDGTGILDNADRGGEGVAHEMIVLGERLDDPYTVENVRKAFEQLYPTKSSRDISPTDLYVRFLPSGEDQMERLIGLGLELTDHPLDYEILREGDYYHDPEVPDETITWQYAVVSHDFSFPRGIRYEIIDECYISENDPATRGESDIDWSEVEKTAYRMTGNGDLLDSHTGTKASSSKPAGRISIVDEEAFGGKPFGVSGVKISCNSFVKFSSTHTDRDGYYTIPKSFSSKVRYRLIFDNEKDFAIGINLILVPASVSALGKGDPSGLNMTVTKESDEKLYRRCAVNNAAYDYYDRCGEDDMDISQPPKGLRLWIFKDMSASTSFMLHHGAIIDMDVLDKYLGVYRTLAKIFLPDITIGTKAAETYSDIYSATVHELSHASHYRKVGNDYWNRFLGYTASSYISSWGNSLGDGSGTNAGYCEVAEMWAFYMESKMYKERYGGAMPTFGTSWWFYPQIFRYLDDRGMTRNEIYAALEDDIVSRDGLHARLISLYPDRQTTIDQLFDRYRN